MTVRLKGARPMFKGTIVSIEAIFITGALLDLIAFSLTSFRLISLTLLAIIKPTLSIFSFVVRVSFWRSGGEGVELGFPLRLLQRILIVRQFKFLRNCERTNVDRTITRTPAVDFWVRGRKDPRQRYEPRLTQRNSLQVTGAVSTSVPP